MVKNLPAMQDTLVSSLHWEDSLEMGMATRSSILAWRIPWIEEPGELLLSMGSHELDSTKQLTHTYTHTHTHTHTHELSGGSGSKESACNAGDTGWTSGWGRLPGEGNGYPLLYSCLENPHGQRSLVSYCPWGGKEFEATERLTHRVTECVLFTCKGQGTDR